MQIARPELLSTTGKKIMTPVPSLRLLSFSKRGVRFFFSMQRKNYSLVCSIKTTVFRAIKQLIVNKIMIISKTIVLSKNLKNTLLSNRALVDSSFAITKTKQPLSPKRGHITFSHFSPKPRPIVTGDKMSE